MFSCCFVLIIRRPPRATRTDTLFPYTTLFRSDHGARSKEWHWPQALRGVRNSAAAQVSARDRPALRTVRPPPPRPRPGAVDALMDARASETSPAAPEFDLELRGKTRRSIGWTITRTLSDQLFSFTFFVVLALLLPRQESGLFAMTTEERLSGKGGG